MNLTLNSPNLLAHLPGYPVRNVRERVVQVSKCISTHFNGLSATRIYFPRSLTVWCRLRHILWQKEQPLLEQGKLASYLVEAKAAAAMACRAASTIPQPSLTLYMVLWRRRSALAHKSRNRSLMKCQEKMPFDCQSCTSKFGLEIRHQLTRRKAICKEKLFPQFLPSFLKCTTVRSTTSSTLIYVYGMRPPQPAPIANHVRRVITANHM